MYDPIEAAQEAINSVKNTPWNSPDRLDKTELARIATATAIISGLAGVGLAIKRSDDATAEHTTALCESIMKLVASSDDNTEKMAALADRLNSLTRAAVFAGSVSAIAAVAAVVVGATLGLRSPVPPQVTVQPVLSISATPVPTPGQSPPPSAAPSPSAKTASPKPKITPKKQH